MRSTTASPRPEPPASRARAASRRVNRSNTRPRSAAAMPGPSSSTVKHDSCRGPARLKPRPGGGVTPPRCRARLWTTWASWRALPSTRPPETPCVSNGDPARRGASTSASTISSRSTTASGSAPSCPRRAVPTRGGRRRGCRGARSRRAPVRRARASRHRRSRKATSRSVRIAATGLRSSWDASDTNSRWRADASSSRSSIPFIVSAKRCTSSRPSGTGTRRCIVVCEIVEHLGADRFDWAQRPPGDHPRQQADTEREHRREEPQTCGRACRPIRCTPSSGLATATVKLPPAAGTCCDTKYTSSVTGIAATPGSSRGFDTVNGNAPVGGSAAFDESTCPLGPITHP